MKNKYHKSNYNKKADLVNERESRIQDNTEYQR